ncbi:OmpH family outer membrane protein [Salidesulfovibrio onnuriiensis]|uniref:OmpH family outer membrane protein n=1 Tax=Salidesulfovibrio onnuriiensis TaxID=2583823 RepID=UPI0016501AB1|nr:OmpH family outer membrane protein [Salidesulfovibrio onnuriiensis]
MKKIIISAVLACVLFATPALAAQKFGFVNLPEVLVKAEPAKQVSEKRAALKKKLQNKLLAERKAIQEMQIQREKQKKMLKPEALEEMDRKIRERMFRFNEDQKKAEAELKEEQNKMSEPVLTLLGKVIDEYGKKNGYTAIFNKLQMPFVADSADVTPEIIKELNNAWKNKK